MSKYTFVAQTQEIGYSALGTLDYAFQNIKFEPYETLTWDTDLISEDLGKDGVGTIYLVPAKNETTGTNYLFHIEAIQDIADDEDKPYDYLWETRLYRENKNDNNN